MSDPRHQDQGVSRDKQQLEESTSESESAPGKIQASREEPDDSREKSFEELSQESQIGLVREFLDFLKYNKKWWLTPIIAVLLLLGLLIFLSTTGAAPFLYTFW